MINKKIEVAGVCDEAKACCENDDTPFTRIVEEKRALDEKIIKLNAFFKDEEKAEKLQAFGRSDKCASSSMSC